MNKTNSWPKMNKTAFSVVSLDDESDEKEYWHSKTPEERLAALELMRRIMYGYDPVSAKVEIVFEVVEANW